MKTKIEIQNKLIITLKVDAIVNAAAPELLGGGGVDGAIHDAAGPGLFKECIKLGGAKTGEAKITKGYELPAKHIIHTVGPIYSITDRSRDELLKDCYKNSLVLADKYKIKTIAFSFISAGVYMYPPELAAQLAFSGINQYLATHPETQVKKIIMIAYTPDEEKVLTKALKESQKFSKE